MGDRITLAGLNATAFGRHVLNSTAISLNSTVLAGAGSVLRISVETANARYRSDGSAPTNTTGVLLFSNVTYEFYGFNGTSKLQFVGDAGAGSVLNVERYKHPGENIS